MASARAKRPVRGCRNTPHRPAGARGVSTSTSSAAVAVGVEHAGAGAEAVGRSRPRRATSSKGCDAARANFTGTPASRRRPLRQHRLRERERPLVAVGEAHRGRHLLGREALEALEVSLGFLRVARALVGAREAELGRDEVRVDARARAGRMRSKCRIAGSVRPSGRRSTRCAGRGARARRPSGTRRARPRHRRCSSAAGPGCTRPRAFRGSVSVAFTSSSRAAS